MKLFTFKSTKKYKRVLFSIICLLIIMFLSAWLIWLDAEKKYGAMLSKVIYDRNLTPLSIAENKKGHYVYQITSVPKDLKNLLIKKEDKFFYYHPGINPVSTMRGIFNYLTKGRADGSSTITQQLAKNLLGTETNRNIFNKLIEMFYALSIEIFTTKETIIEMYANSVYLGNQIQGFNTASFAYFAKPLTTTTHSEKMSLLATLSYPSTRNPWEKDNTKYAQGLNNQISPDEIFSTPSTANKYSFQQDSIFELKTAGINCENSCVTTIDDSLSQKIREILDRHIVAGFTKNIKNGAVVVIDPKSEELLVMIGSKNPNNATNGNQINMAIEPRPIGSTIKPFIYAKGFEMGLRPYSIVDDREYKYPIATGFSLYPKNYDGQYRGEITLHEALSNSLNVPSVKTLEYVGLNNFYAFLSNDLKFEPIQDYGNYQYGIALGGLEMDLTTLTHYFTLFPRRGSIAPLRVLQADSKNFDLPPQSHLSQETKIIAPEFIDLVHTIISDRFTGVNQFGIKGNLNLTFQNYAVKTGTSRDFHDSWVVGYTPDLVVGVWLGNSENQPLEQVSGSSGAGAVWHDVMEYLATTKYYTPTPFTTDTISRFNINQNDEWGLPNDVISEHQNLLQEDNLILSLHEGDKFELTKDTTIPLRSRRPVTWTVNGKFIDTTHETTFHAIELGRHEVIALEKETGTREIITIEITSPEQ